jgi:hypothetical protein
VTTLNHIDAIEARATTTRAPVDWRRVWLRVRLAVVAFLPMLVGYTVGVVVWVAVRVGAAFLEGFDKGRGSAPAQRPGG